MTHSTKRTAALQQLLQERQRDIQDDLQSRIRRTRHDRPDQGRDQLEQADDDAQAGLGYVLLQMKTEQLTRVEEALQRLEVGGYGACVECDREIAARRLRALPFAVRCQACQEAREAHATEGRRDARRDGGLSLFTETINA